ncbi:targeting protein for Xklp2-like isoform X2 [Lethenteron reissneri]|uniref:targeting protein for Xklp2-like isoform X2 n=1 Tax=Lethenteron reissneri TaxID=7753 RepID=UPI002AB61908|nr:targeting protein for Xklp2-like isoform X2 [Lethenteron reissneri]
MSNQYVYDFDAPTCGDFGSVVDNDNADAWFDNRQEDHQAFHDGADFLVEDLPVMSNVDSDKGAELPDEEMLDEEEVEAEAGAGTASNAESLAKRNEDAATASAKSADNVVAKETRADIPQISIEKLPGTFEPAEGYSRVAAQLAMEAMIPAKDEFSDQGGDMLDAPNRVEKSDGDRASVSSMDVECAADTVQEGADIIPMRVGNSPYDVACPAEETREEEAKVNQCEAAENQQPAEGNGSAKEDLCGDDDDESSEEKSVVAARSEAENNPEETREPGTDLFNLCRSVTKWRTGVTAGARVASVVPPATRRSAIVTRLDPLAGQKNRASVRKQLTNIRAGRRTISVTSTASSRVSSPAVKRSKRSGSLSKSSAAEVAQPKLRSTKSAEHPEPEKVEAKQQAPQRLKRSSAVSTFTFRTDKRAKASDQVGEPYHHVDFVANLRKSSAASPTKKAQPSRTVIQPFKLMTRGSKRKFEEALQSGRLISHPTKGTAAFKSMAEQLLEFERRTPQRFHLRSRKDLEKGPSPITARPDSCTMPMTPHLVTRMRQRSPTCKSSAQLEQEELERIQAHQFKAHKLDPHLLEPGSVPIGRRCRSHEGARLTAETEQRVRERVEERLRHEEEERLKERAMHQFHARPLPVAILEQVSGVPEKATLPMTIPESPAFTLKHRVLTRKDLSQLEAPRPVTRANPMPHFGLPFQPRPEMRTVEPEPFSFDARDQERAERRERRIQEIRQLEEQVPQFKAQPVPDLEHVALPEKHLRPLTQHEPFHLRVDERGSIKTEQFNKKLKEEEEQKKEHATFRARPCRVTTTAPFVAQRHNRILARVENVELNTVRRARERAEYDAQLAEQRRQNEAAWELRLQEQAEEERQMILQQRKEVVHKANPVRHYKAVVIQQSSRPLTNPRSPCFSDRFDL